MKTSVLFLLLLAPAPGGWVCTVAAQEAAAEGAASDGEFRKVEEAFRTAAPSQEVVDRLYEFMEKYPKDPRADRVQLWAGLAQQKRKFHNEAIKELSFVASDFPRSPLVPQAVRAMADSYAATRQPEKAAECFGKLFEMKPAGEGDPGATAQQKADRAAAAAAYRDAVLFLADAAARKPDVDAAVALYMQLPGRDDAVARVVELYLASDRPEDAIKTIRRLPDTHRLWAYRLLAAAYAPRPGTANLYGILDDVLTKEKPGEAVDPLVQFLAATLGQKSEDDRRKALDAIDKRYDRLRRWAQYQLCTLDKQKDVERLTRFVGDYHTGADVEAVKGYVGQFYELAARPDKAREAYGRLDDAVAAAFASAQTYYGELARKKDYDAGRKALGEIVKRFYSPASAAEALYRRAKLEAGPMAQAEWAIATYRELIDRFPKQGDYPIRATQHLAELLRARHKQDEAIAAYERLIAQYPDNPAVRAAWYQIGLCHEEKAEPARAVETFKAVLRKFPRTREASEAHTRLEQKYNIADTEVSDR